MLEEWEDASSFGRLGTGSVSNNAEEVDDWLDLIADGVVVGEGSSVDGEVEDDGDCQSDRVDEEVRVVLVSGGSCHEPAVPTSAAAGRLLAVPRGGVTNGSPRS